MPRALWARARISISCSGGNDLGDQLELGLQEGLELGDPENPEALDALDHQAQGPVGELEHLVDVGECTDPVEVSLHRIVDRGVALRDDSDDLALAEGIVDEGDGALPGHGQGENGVGEQDGIAKREDSQLSGSLANPHVVNAGRFEVRLAVVLAHGDTSLVRLCSAERR